MFKSLISYKQFLTYVAILLIGIEIGIFYSASRHRNGSNNSSSTSSSWFDIATGGGNSPGTGIGTGTGAATGTTDGSANPNDNCRNPAAIATEPAAEILGAPEFMDPGTLKSTVQGWIHVRWKPVNGAKSYNVRVWDQASNEVKNFQTFRTFSFLKNLNVDPRLKETPYSVIVTPLGEGEVKGKASPKKLAAMLPLRNLQPPTIKSIQTEADGVPQEETPKTEITK